MEPGSTGTEYKCSKRKSRVNYTNLWMITCDWYSIYKLNCTLHIILLFKITIWLPTLITVNNITYSYTAIFTFITVCKLPNYFSATNIKSIPNYIKRYLKHIIIIRSHDATDDCNIKQTYTMLLTKITIIMNYEPIIFIAISYKQHRTIDTTKQPSNQV